MKPLYDFSIRTFSKLAGISKGSNAKLEKLVDGRKDLFERLTAFKSGFSKPIAWFHVASLGEYEQAKPVIAELKHRKPDYGIVVSFFSPSGYEIANRKAQENVDFITYLPFDTATNAKNFLGILDPKIGFFVKYDLWANHILEAKERHIPLFLFSASMREDQIYFKGYGTFFKKILTSFDHIFTQNTQTKTLIEGLDFYQVSVAGDTRYDRVKSIAEAPKSFPEILPFVNGRKTMVVGSAWEEDMKVLIPFINAHPEYFFIVAPHDINLETLAEWKSKISRPSLKYSEISGQETADVLFIDNIGMLSSLYQFAHISYVGGAFGKGLHNILEAIAYSIPVIFGELKKEGKFPEAGISQEYGCGFSVSNTKQLEKTILYLSDQSHYLQACQTAEKLVSDNVGSAKKIMDTVITKINQA
ncbi:3-deoxy-D-manno-octulosonic acid transferase [Cognataquiflexum rubidum]|uniref:3-deoxy-D-manno-octulosonic acid transferase n=1 Tax=Cognataquiflexum rubidum TaxID=2922273 RepID=UPI001F1428FC|nr:glycosyltransferase N-terminal domain-containing protein [Cognataquiflexum rubidum]MCH6235991.1 3-deoxy-D-manno-octulosonic acid transferase [Cognataquiflexum rubidum]